MTVPSSTMSANNQSRKTTNWQEIKKLNENVPSSTKSISNQSRNTITWKIIKTNIIEEYKTFSRAYNIPEKYVRQIERRWDFSYSNTPALYFSLSFGILIIHITNKMIYVTPGVMLCRVLSSPRRTMARSEIHSGGKEENWLALKHLQL